MHEEVSILRGGDLGRFLVLGASVPPQVLKPGPRVHNRARLVSAELSDGTKKYVCDVEEIDSG